MAISAFEDKKIVPNDEMVKNVLGGNYILWENIKMHLHANYQNLNEDWKFYSKESGWTKNIKSGKRTLFMFVPIAETFKLYFTFSERAIAVARISNLSDEVISSIPDTKQCACGFSFMFTVKTKGDIDTVLKLIEIKDKN